MKRDGSGPLIRYRTPADVRAIPNDRWEDWLRTDTVPWAAFSAERRVQRLAAGRIIRSGR